MADKMWMGIPGTHMQWVPCPLIASGITRKRYTERIQFQNGGGDAARSAQYQLEYNFQMNGLAHELENIDAINDFASGVYGDGLIYVAHPANYKANVMGAPWATPSLIGEGWYNIYPPYQPNIVDTRGDEFSRNVFANPNFKTNEAGVSKTGSTVITRVLKPTGFTSATTQFVLKIDFGGTGADKVKFTVNNPSVAMGSYYSLVNFATYFYSTNSSGKTFSSSWSENNGAETFIESFPLDSGDQLVTLGTDLPIGNTNTGTFQYILSADAPTTIYLSCPSICTNSFYAFSGDTLDGTNSATYSWIGVANNSVSLMSLETLYNNQPKKSARFAILSAPNVPIKKFTIPVPPDKGLNIFVNGSVTGSAAVNYIAYSGDSIFETGQLAIGPESGSASPYNLFQGNQVDSVAIYLTRTATTSVDPSGYDGSTILLSSMDAQYFELGSGGEYSLNLNHMQGEGAMGMMFADDAIVETYSYMYPPRKGISTTLVEVEPWR
jgi:hypothetical protein